MPSAKDAPHERAASAIGTVLWIGLVAGTLDITDALIFSGLRGTTPTIVFQYIASALIGPKAFDLGASSVFLGGALHYFIALTWTVIFFVASRKLPILGRRPILSGVLYGGVVYLFMNMVVIPLSRLPKAESGPTLISVVNGVLAVVLFIGLTISLLVRRSSAPYPRLFG
jgi:hypothetical protein